MNRRTRQSIARFERRCTIASTFIALFGYGYIAIIAIEAAAR